MEFLELRDPIKDAVDIRRRQVKSFSEAAYKSVERIIGEVREEGDMALIQFTKEFDGVDIKEIGIVVGREEIDDAYEYVDNEFIRAVDRCKERLKIFEEKLIEHLNIEYMDSSGIRIRHVVKPIESVGCYVPGGEARYPSTVLMTCVPAKVAGVKKVTITTPPRKDGSIDPFTLVASDMVGVDKIYRVGGAQAIAALAYGTESIENVDKIVGPGNIYVSLAKLFVSSQVSIDFYAGPTELLIFADEYADSEKIVMDLISQAEHDPLSTVGFITTSKRFAEIVFNMIKKNLRDDLDRIDIVRRSVENGFVVYGDLEKCIKFINSFAPEHLQIMARDLDGIVPRIENAGVVLLGEYTPTSLSDYCLGTNHVLPTMGMARRFSGLSAIDFVKTIRIAEASSRYLREFGRFAMKIAESEGLMNHARSIEMRFEDE